VIIQQATLFYYTETAWYSTLSFHFTCTSTCHPSSVFKFHTWRSSFPYA